MVVPPVLWYTTLYNLQAGNLKLALNKREKTFLARHHGDGMVIWYVAVLITLAVIFWYYWRTLLS